MPAKKKTRRQSKELASLDATIASVDKVLDGEKRYQALELAVQIARNNGEKQANIVAMAEAFHGFLTGKPAAKPETGPAHDIERIPEGRPDL